MAGGLLNFIVGLEDKVSPGAKAAANALKHLETELTTSKAKLASFQQQLSHAKELGDIEGYRKYTALVASARKETFQLGNALIAAGGPAQKMGDHIHRVVAPADVARQALAGVTAGLSGFASSLRQGDVKGAIEGAADALAGFASLLDLVVPGLGQAAAAVIKFGGAIGGVFAEIVEEGIKTALEVTEVNEKLTATFEALGDKQGQGKKTLQFLNELSSKLPQSRDQLAKWTKQFEAFGVTDLGELRQQIRATAAAQAILGDEGAQAYTKLAEKIQDAVHGHHKLKMGKDVLKDIALSGVSASEVAKKLGMTLQEMDSKLKAGTIDAKAFGNALEATLIEKGRKPLEAMSSDIGVLKEKAVEAFHHLFDGIDTKPITDGIKGLIGVLNLGKPSGKAMHDGIVSALQGVINWMGKALHEGKILFLTLELYTVKHRKELKFIGEGFAQVGKSILLAAKALEFLLNAASKPPPAWLTMLLTGGLVTGGLPGGPAFGKQRGHADGGMVSKPAAGEFFASVAPGEMILPQRQAKELMGSGIGPSGRQMIAANSNGGPGGGVHIDHLELTIQAPHGVTDAQSVSATGLALALERYQLASGR